MKISATVALHYGAGVAFFNVTTGEVNRDPTGPVNHVKQMVPARSAERLF